MIFCPDGCFLKCLPIRKKKQDEEEADQKKMATETAYQGIVSLIKKEYVLCEYFIYIYILKICTY